MNKSLAQIPESNKWDWLKACGKHLKRKISLSNIQNLGPLDVSKTDQFIKFPKKLQTKTAWITGPFLGPQRTTKAPTFRAIKASSDRSFLEDPAEGPYCCRTAKQVSALPASGALSSAGKSWKIGQIVLATRKKHQTVDLEFFLCRISCHLTACHELLPFNRQAPATAAWTSA